MGGAGGKLVVASVRAAGGWTPAIAARGDF